MTLLYNKNTESGELFLKQLNRICEQNLKKYGKTHTEHFCMGKKSLKIKLFD